MLKRTLRSLEMDQAARVTGRVVALQIPENKQCKTDKPGPAMERISVAESTSTPESPRTFLRQKGSQKILYGWQKQTEGCARGLLRFFTPTQSAGTLRRKPFPAAGGLPLLHVLSRLKQ